MVFTALAAVLNDKDFRGQIPAQKVNARLAAEKLTRDELMLKLLPEAQSHANAPISNYFVGAVASGLSGALYLGQNIEIPGNPLGLAIHAEQSAIANAYMSGEIGIDAIAIKGAPCGHCRQFLSETAAEITLRVLTPDNPPLKLADLLPRPFGPKQLGFKQGAFPITKRTLGHATTNTVARIALEAAQQAYSPYSRSPSGVAIETSTGRIFAGSYIENAAFNPSLPPLQAALAGYFAAGKPGTIKRAVLFEGAKNAISQRVTTEATLAAFAADAHLDRLTF